MTQSIQTLLLDAQAHLNDALDQLREARDEARDAAFTAQAEAEVETADLDRADFADTLQARFEEIENAEQEADALESTVASLAD